MSAVYIKTRRGAVREVASVEAASELWNDYRDALLINGGGGSRDIGNGWTVYADRACTVEVARVSYNGRIWPAQVAA